MSREVSHKASNTDVTYTNYMHHNIVSTSTHTVLQVGGRCTAYSINVTQGFLDAIKDKGGRLTFSVSEEPLLQLSWEGNTDVSQACITKWKVDVLSVFKGCKMAIMQEISKDIFDPLRRVIIERMYQEYDAQLSALLGGSLTFVFMHRNRHDADKMIEKKHDINKIFQQLFGHIGNMEVKFALSAERDVGSWRWIQSSVQEPSGKYPSDDRSESHIPSSKIDSVEMELKQLRGEVSEMKNILYKMSDKILSDTHVSKVTPLSQTEEQMTTIILPEKYTPAPPEVPVLVAPVTVPIYGSFVDNSAAEDGDMGSRVSCGKTNLMAEQHDQTEPSHAGPKPCDHTCGIQQKEDTARKESLREIPEPTRQQNRFDQTIAKNYGRAEMLLNSLQFHRAGQGHLNHRFNRLAISVAVALEPEDPKPPKAKAQDTVLCLDVSESLGQEGFEEVKQAAHEFVDGIEAMAEKHGLEENLALVAMGGGARVVRQLTNDYTAIRDAIDDLFMGGRSPIFEALLVCIAAIKEKGGTLSIGGVHDLKPRIIFLTDGYATDDSVVEGSDLTEVDPNIRIQILQLNDIINARETDPVIWVAAGNADRPFLSSLSKRVQRKLVDCKNIESLWKHYMLQDNIGKIYIHIKNSKFEETPETLKTVVLALTGDMDEEDREFVVQGVQQKLDFYEVPDPDEKPSDFHNVHEVSDLPPLGTRVVRGPDWQYENQDCEGPGTIVNHANDRYMLWVLWDFNGHCFRYRYGHDGKMDVVEIEGQPRFLLQDELIEIGVRVKRGVDWSHGYQDGGEGSTGVVIRKREDGVVKVKWQNGNLESYKYGLDGTMDVIVCEPDDFMKVRNSTQDVTTSRGRTGIANAGEVGYARATKETPHIVWQWQDDKAKWHLYSESDTVKLEKEFTRKPSGSCVLQKERKNVRVLFKQPMLEKEVGGGSSYAVKRSAVSHAELRELKGE
ncbi:uncharacterized protein [Haliotis asinina]|uniref:uncharacterized protein n=1 Tax=Haliotis asinina TaxID=109174 RepID=UPI003531ACFF